MTCPKPVPEEDSWSDNMVFMSAKRKLAIKNFDPMDKMIKLYGRLEDEDAYHTRLREANRVIKLDPETGKPVKTLRYSAVAHTTIFSQMKDIGTTLLPYCYDKDEGEDDKVPSINITLSK
jgi:hypothetical protein